jgi:hypothetical protein
LGHGIEVAPLLVRAVVRRQAETETMSCAAGHDVEMCVWHFLSRRFTVGSKDPRSPATLDPIALAMRRAVLQTHR